ncbi:hypothetical protein N3K66_002354 [Trichothecium roseum]|uniref:Uncharacterized protein n=1 Tax=Trichothecium roseum TaxID=47278 RepID=A0ACC0V9C5_9HYPO|nr:hypothetical protein N3K66_002354 [Trichothecium roseum]
MAANQPDLLGRFQRGLEPYIKPREQTNYIRRILALHLASCSGDKPSKQPPALPHYLTEDVEVAPDLRGVFKTYAEALRVNVAARRRFEDALQAQTKAAPPPRSSTPESDEGSSGGDGGTFLQNRIAVLKLRKKRQKLQAIQAYVDELAEKPAATSTFLNADRIFDGAEPLPSVPKEIVDSLVAENSSPKLDLRAHTSQIEKLNLRAKLLLRQEERLLAEARSRSNSTQDVVSHGVKLEALSATRNELITWIENELGSASKEETGEEAEEAPSSKGGAQDQAIIAARLLEIKEKYGQYLVSRRSILSLASQAPQQQLQQSFKPDLGPPTQAGTAVEPPKEPLKYLITPHIEQLLSLAEGQKTVIAQKSHLNIALNRQSKEAYQMLGLLAEESQLLPQYPMKESLRRKSGLISELASKRSEQPDLANRIKPWVFAADSAKIANLEEIAETIEHGQIALESSTNTLSTIDHLLGIHQKQETVEDEPTEDDLWYGAAETKGATVRKHTETKKKRVEGDPWSALHGNLGTIGNDDQIK